MTTTIEPERKNLLHRIGDELREYAFLSLYLYICFGAIMLYTVAVLRAHGIDYTPWGFAAVKALILAKFMLLGKSIYGRAPARRRALAFAVLYRSFAYFGFLVVLSLAEEAVAGLIHGRPVADSLSRVAGGTGIQILATCVLLWLILVPVAAIQQISALLGKRSLNRVLFDASQWEMTHPAEAVASGE
jgi:hypothetical protein